MQLLFYHQCEWAGCCKPQMPFQILLLLIFLRSFFVTAQVNFVCVDVGTLKPWTCVQYKKCTWNWEKKKSDRKSFFYLEMFISQKKISTISKSIRYCYFLNTWHCSNRIIQAHLLHLCCHCSIQFVWLHRIFYILKSDWKTFTMQLLVDERLYRILIITDVHRDSLSTVRTFYRSMFKWNCIFFHNNVKLYRLLFAMHSSSIELLSLWGHCFAMYFSHLECDVPIRNTMFPSSDFYHFNFPHRFIDTHVLHSNR